jgi:hypothetical protein
MLSYVVECLNAEIQSHYPAWKTKLKVHLLQHIPDCYKEYGPLSLLDAEGSEQGNGTVRWHVCQTNRHSPSKDVAERFSIAAAVRDLLQGLICCDSSGKWQQPGRLVRLLGHQNLLAHALRIQGSPVPKHRLKVGNFYVFGINHAIGKLTRSTAESHQLQVLTSRPQLDSFGCMTYQLTPQIVEVNQADVSNEAAIYHLCELNSCRQEPNGSITHSLSNLYSLSMFSFEHHHDITYPQLVHAMSV